MAIQDEEVPPTVADKDSAVSETGAGEDELPADDEEGEALLRLTFGKAGLVIPDSLIVDSDSDDGVYREVPAGCDYVTSQSRKQGLRKLHRVGWCCRTPGMDYKIHKSYQAAPAQTEYDKMCKQCWKHQGLGTARSSVDTVSSGSASTSSSTGEDQSGENDEDWHGESQEANDENTEAMK